MQTTPKAYQNKTFGQQREEKYQKKQRNGKKNKERWRSQKTRGEPDSSAFLDAKRPSRKETRHGSSIVPPSFTASTADS